MTAIEATQFTAPATPPGQAEQSWDYGDSAVPNDRVDQITKTSASSCARTGSLGSGVRTTAGANRSPELTGNRRPHSQMITSSQWHAVIMKSCALRSIASTTNSPYSRCRSRHVSGRRFCYYWWAGSMTRHAMRPRVLVLVRET